MFGRPGHHGSHDHCEEEEGWRRREEEERLRRERGHHYSHQPYSYPPPPDVYPPRDYCPPPPTYPSNVQHVSHEAQFDTGLPLYPHNPWPPGAYPHGAYSSPPSSNVQHVSHEAPFPAPHESSCGAPLPNPVSNVQHVSHEAPFPVAYGGYGAAPPNPSSNVQHVSHEAPFQTSYSPSLHHGWRLPFGSSSHQRTVRIYPKAGEGFSLTIRNGEVVLARADRNDEYQHWIKDEKYSTKVKDEDGFPSFALVNKVTGEAIKHSIGATHPVRLIHYNPDYLDESVLWTESKDTGQGFRCIRMVNNTNITFDAFNGDKEHGGVRDGTIVVLWECWKGDNQRWKIVPY